MLGEVPKSVIAQNVLLPITEGSSFGEIHISDLAELEKLMEIEGLQETIEQTLNMAKWGVCDYKRFLPEGCVRELGIDLVVGPSESQTHMKYFPETLIEDGDSESIYCSRLFLSSNKDVPYFFLDRKINKCWFSNSKVFFEFKGQNKALDAFGISLTDGECNPPTF